MNPAAELSDVRQVTRAARSVILPAVLIRTAAAIATARIPDVARAGTPVLGSDGTTVTVGRVAKAVDPAATRVMDPRARAGGVRPLAVQAVGGTSPEVTGVVRQARPVATDVRTVPVEAMTGGPAAAPAVGPAIGRAVQTAPNAVAPEAVTVATIVPPASKTRGVGGMSADRMAVGVRSAAPGGMNAALAGKVAKDRAVGTATVRIGVVPPESLTRRAAATVRAVSTLRLVDRAGAMGVSKATVVSGSATSSVGQDATGASGGVAETTVPPAGAQQDVANHSIMPGAAEARPEIGGLIALVIGPSGTGIRGRGARTARRVARIDSVSNALIVR